MTDANPQLVPGSIWQRTRKGKTSFVTVIAVSNTTLAPEVLDRFPRQVVFITDKFNILTQEVEFFTANRTFSSMDAGISNLMEAVVSPPDEADEEESETIDIDGIQLDEQPAEPEAPSDNSDEAPAPVFKPASVDGIDLDAHFLSYSEMPHHTGDTLHVIRFQLDKTLTIENLRTIFSPSNPSSLEEFCVDSNHELTMVNIDGFIQVFLEAGYDAECIGAVYVTSAGDFRAQPQPEMPAEGAPGTPIEVPGMAIDANGSLLALIPQVAPAASEQIHFQ